MSCTGRLFTLHEVPVVLRVGSLSVYWLENGKTNKAEVTFHSTELIGVHVFNPNNKNRCDVAAPDAQPDPPSSLIPHTPLGSLIFYIYTFISPLHAHMHAQTLTEAGARRHGEALQRLFVLHESLIRVNC